MDLSGLNKQQCQAVLHGPGPCCVLAGAGSGKTRVLTFRIARLIEEGVRPENILAVTFTKKAATEMVERLESLLGPGSVEELNIGTFHSICYRIIREEWRALGRRVPQVAEEYWQKRVVKNILAPQSQKNPWGMDWDLDVGQALAWISQQKNNLIGPQDKLIVPESQVFLEGRYRELYRRYEKAKASENKLDFDDMLWWAFQLLRDNPAILSKYQGLLQWLLVDEFQDTNLAQYEILKLLAPPQNNLFVVGDDYQAIYGWRSARVDFILKFASTWQGAVGIPLEINYRSTEDIVKYSNLLISHNDNQKQKTCRANRKAMAEPVFLANDDEELEAEVIAQEILSLTGGEQAKYGYGDIAVLYRVNAYSRALEEAFIKAGLPHVIIGAVGFYERKEVKDILAYLRAAARGDEEAAKRVINVPNRYLGRAFVQAAERYQARHGCSFLEAVRDCPEAAQRRYAVGVGQFLGIIEQVAAWVREGWSPEQMVTSLRKVTGYDAWLLKEEGGDEGPDNPRLENLAALVQAAARFKTVEEFLAYVDRATGKEPDHQEPAAGGRVQLMTLHKAKGLEFAVVFMAGVSEGLLPHRKAVQYRDGEEIAESLEEERRLAYVGMTRAMDLLYLSSVESYLGKFTVPSRFVREVGFAVEKNENGAGAA